MPKILSWRPLSPFGVEIDHDLSQPLDAEQARELHGLLYAHGLVLARGQTLTMEQQRALCAHIGPILLREGEDGYMTNEAGGPSAAPLSWHSDAAYTDDPFDALSLHALEVTEGASCTRFISAEQAWQALPPNLQARLEGCDQEMISPHYTRISGRTCDERDPEAMKRGVCPAVFVNPHTGRKCVWVSELQTARLLGLEWEESRDLLHAVYERIYADNLVLEHPWYTGDIVIWDNIALQHARGNLEQVGKRLLQRVIVGTHGVAPHVVH